jgi:hypothetical protein
MTFQNVIQPPALFMRSCSFFVSFALAYKHMAIPFPTIPSPPPADMTRYDKLLTAAG